MDLRRHYSSSFYSDHSVGSQSSAEIVLALVFDLLQPKSVLDVGCGVGTWLAAARKLGAKRLIGYEGSHVNREMLQDGTIELRHADLQDGLSIPDKVDLAMSLEVAEHVDEEAGRRIVKELSVTANAILFGAAIPYQGGSHHINERWQSYWIALFSEHGFDAYDVLRSACWNDERVEPWYAQNAFLYLRRNSHPLLHRRLEGRRVIIADVVNLRTWQRAQDTYNNPGLRESLRLLMNLPRTVMRAAVRQWRRLVGKNP